MNIALDFLFIGIIGIGTAGAAAATVLSQLFSAVCCFLYLRDNYPGLLFQKEDLGVHTELMSQSLHFGLISALQASSLYIGKILVQGSVNTLGTPGIAAYTAATRIEGFANSFGDSGGSAISVMVSQNLGAGNHDRVKKSLKWGMLLNWTVGIIVSLLMFIGSDQALRLFLGSSDELALHYGNGYIRLISLFYIFCFTGSAYMGYFKGRGHMLLAFFGTTGHILLRPLDRKNGALRRRSRNRDRLDALRNVSYDQLCANLSYREKLNHQTYTPASGEIPLISITSP